MGLNVRQHSSGVLSTFFQLMAKKAKLEMFRLLKNLLRSGVLISTIAPSGAGQVASVEDSFDAMRLWLQGNAPALVRQLNPPVTDAEFAAFAEQTGLILPKSVRAAYAIHDGEKESSQGMFGAWRWMPLSEVTAIRLQPNEFGGSITDIMIPIVASGGGDYLYVESVDSHSDESEVMEWWHEEPTRDVRHASFAAMLHQFVADLKRGKYVYRHDDFVGLIDKDDL